MDILRQLIQTIVVVVVLAVFLEMLLPRGDMRRYVRMVMGLLIIVAVLQAFTAAINSDLLRDVPGVTATGAEPGPVPLESIMAAGTSLSEANRREAAKQYSEGLARQVESLAGLNDGVRVAGASVLLDDQNAISKIIITCTAGGRMPAGVPDRGEEAAIRPVIIGIGEENGLQGAPEAVPGDDELEAAAELAGVVADFYNLRREQVEVKFQ